MKYHAVEELFNEELDVRITVYKTDFENCLDGARFKPVWNHGSFDC